MYLKNKVSVCYDNNKVEFFSSTGLHLFTLFYCLLCGMIWSLFIAVLFKRSQACDGTVNQHLVIQYLFLSLFLLTQRAIVVYITGSVLWIWISLRGRIYY